MSKRSKVANRTARAGFVALGFLLAVAIGVRVWEFFQHRLALPLLLSGILVVAAALFAAVVVGRLLRDLERERDQSHAILSSIETGVVSVDPEGRITSMNSGMERLSGWSKAEVVGKRYLDAFEVVYAGGEKLTEDERPLMRALRTGKIVRHRGYDLFLIRRDASPLPVGLTAAPINTGRSDGVGAVLTVEDVSHQRELDQIKSALVSTVSHELRTPLTMIQGFSELLLTRRLAPERSREALEQINSAAQRLARLIEDLLSVSRIESGRLVLSVAPTDLRVALEDALAPFGATEDRRFVLDVPDGLPPVLADPDKLLQVITNLVSNAVKYSPEDSTITISASANGSSVVVSIADEGIGMNEDEQQNLFNKFYRVDRDEVREVRGTGLGLYITKSLVEMQGGRISVTSERGEGSIFTFSLPVVREVERLRQREEVEAL